MFREKLKPINVLLVEDSPTDRLLAAEALAASKRATNLLMVEDGLEALLFLRKQGKYKDAVRPDLILLDLNLPKKDGREVLAEIKADQVLGLIPIVVLSTSKADQDLVSAYRLHANCYLVKPVDFAQFSDMVASVLNFWFEVVSLPGEAAVQQLVRPQATRRTALTHPAAGQTVRVLLVEDNHVDAMLLRQGLDESTSVRFLVTQVQRLSDARVKLLTDKFDIVLVDLGLPDSQGLDTYRRLRTEAGELPVIVLTALDDDEIGMKALQEGARDYVIKGHVSGRMLIRAIRYAVVSKHFEEQLRQAQRMEAIGQLAGGVAHDFNNILTIIQGHASMLPSRLKTMDADVAESIKEITEASQRAGSLTRQLLTYSRRQHMQTRPVELNLVVENIATMLRRILGEDIHLELGLPASLPMIEADVGMLEQVIMNLAVNARDAMPGGGKFVIQTAQVDVNVGRETKNLDAYPGRFVCLRLTDTGVGIAPEHLSHIFEPFFTTKDVGKGTGLGLATVYGILKLHQGWADVVSAVGMGTTFHIYLPVTGRTQEANPPALEAKPSGGSETILLVEDEEGVRQMVRMVLRKAGYKVLDSNSGAAALAVWNKKTAPIDLVLTDIVMPGGLNGHQLVEKLRAEKPDLKVIFTSGYNFDSHETGANLTEGVNFLRKPYSFDQLSQIVRRCLDTAAPRNL